MGQRRGDLVEVELVDDDFDDERPRGPSRARRLSPRWRSLPARTRWGLTRLGTAVAAVGCLAVVVQQGTVAADEAALELLPGRSVALDQPLTEVWHLDDSYPVAWVDGDLVVSGGSSGATQRIDPATGAARWSVPGTGWCSPLDPGAWRNVDSSGLPTLDGTRLFCVPETTYSADGVVEQTSTAFLLDAADGTTTTGPSIAGQLIAIYPVEADLVVATATADGRVNAERWSPGSGQTVWRYASADAVVEAWGGYGVGEGTGVLEIYGSRTVLVDLATGEELPAGQDASAAAEASVTSQLTLPDGSMVRGIAGASTSYARTAADGTALLPLPGWPVRAGVDDGSGAGVALVATTDRLVAAVDLATGTTLWSTDGTDVVGVLDHLAIVQGTLSLSARDIRTGKVAWTDPLPTDVFTGMAVTDGHYVAHLTAGGGVALRAVDVRTGAEQALTPIYSYGGWVVGASQDGTVIVANYEGGLSGLRP